jgi:CheY-like chemotaxis protein
MDIQMPVMDGLEATQRIREMEADGTIASGNYIVATSANATAENHREGYEAGMDEYITKPIYPTKLKELLAKPKRMQTALELDEAGDGEVTSLVGRKGSG